MKAITLWEPWASFVADGFKRYETRSWTTRYRGNIAIHASRRWQRNQILTLDHLTAKFPALREKYDGHQFPLGCVVAACRLVGVHRTEDVRDSITALERALGDFGDGRFAWELEIVKLPPEPIPASGNQGIWVWNYSKDEHDG